MNRMLSNQDVSFNRTEYYIYNQVLKKVQLAFLVWWVSAELIFSLSLPHLHLLGLTPTTLGPCLLTCPI